MSAIEQPPAHRSTVARTTILALLAIVLTFASGFVAGFAVDRFVMMRRPHVPPFAAHAMVRHLDRALDLTPQQRTAIEEILKRRHERMNAIWTAAQPRVRAEIDATNAEIERLLTPEQRQRFERMKMHMSGGHHGGPFRRE